MTTITTPKKAYKWLRTQAEKSTSVRRVHYLFPTIYDAVNAGLDNGEPV